MDERRPDEPPAGAGEGVAELARDGLDDELTFSPEIGAPAAAADADPVDERSGVDMQDSAKSPRERRGRRVADAGEHG